MNKPSPAVKKALADLCEMKPVQDVFDWIRGERDGMDKVNRNRGQENQESAAHALTVILDEFDAARADRSKRHTM